MRWAGAPARALPYSSSSSLIESTSECTPSLSIAELPVTAAATNLVTAMATLPASATRITTREEDFVFAMRERGPERNEEAA